MESRVWNSLLSVLPTGPVDSRRFTHDTRVILLVHMWSVLHDRPTCWACQPEHWPDAIRPPVLPHPSTMCRRLRSPQIIALRRELDRELVARLQTDQSVAFIDGKPFGVARHSKDPDSTWGYGAGGTQRGYKWHVISTRDNVILECCICPMNQSEQVVARKMILATNASFKRLVGDTSYDSMKIHDAAAATGRVLYTKLREQRVGRRQQHERLRCLRMLSRTVGRELLQLRDAVERTFARSGNIGFGIKPLPNWVRRAHRVDAWIRAKIALYHAWLLLSR